MDNDLIHQELPAENRRAARLWLWHRISGALLVVLVGIHVWIMHVQSPGVPPEYADVARRLRTLFFVVTDFGILLLAIYHGLNGIRNIMFDHIRSRRKRRIVTNALCWTGILFIALGASALFKVMIRG